MNRSPLTGPFRAQPGDVRMLRTPTMLRCPLVAGLLLAAFLVAGPRPAAAGEVPWRIADYQVTIAPAADGTVFVSERIVADFGTNQRHGIYRAIPTRYDVAGHLYRIKVRLQGVVDANGRAYEVDQKTGGRDHTLRIGSASVIVTGRNEYVLTYTVRHAVLFDRDGAALHWNAIGHEWGVPTDRAGIRVVPPPGSGPDAMFVDAWTGSFGARGRSFTRRDEADGAVVFDVGALRPREGVTVSATFAPGVIAAPSVRMPGASPRMPRSRPDSAACVMQRTADASATGSRSMAMAAGRARSGVWRVYACESSTRRTHASSRLARADSRDGWSHWTACRSISLPPWKNSCWPPRNAPT